MNRKLYFLNNEEKNRILRLHENATKKQYILSELESDVYSITGVEPSQGETENWFKKFSDEQSDTVNKSSTVKKVSDDWISLDPTYDEQILRALGKTGKKLSNDDIIELYNKLKERSKI